MPYHDVKPDELVLRDLLARDRTVLANERTFLAYTRTALMMFLAGVTLIKLFPEDRAITWVGYACFPAGLAIVVTGAWRFVRVRSDLRLVDASRAKTASPGVEGTHPSDDCN